MQTIGKLNLRYFIKLSKEITTDEVVITDERIQHIKDRHPGDFEEYAGYIKAVVEDPDYILEANKPDSAFLLKTIKDANKNFEAIVRLAVIGDPQGHKNSIITFLKVEKKRYNRYLRTKKILYKKEE